MRNMFGNTSVLIAGTLAIFATCPAFATPRTIILADDYYAASTLDPLYNPALDPDMDGDGAPDLSQENLQALVDLLANGAAPEHAATHATFEANEAIALAALSAAYGSQPLVAPLSELWAVYMTIQGPGAYAGPTHTGMIGRVEVLWVFLGLAAFAGDFDSQPWEQAAPFVIGPQNPTLSLSTGGLVVEGSSVSLFVTPSTATAYTWYKDDSPLSGADGPAHVISTVSLADAGAYRCTVEFAGGDSLDTPTVDLVVTPAAAVPVHSVSMEALSLLLLAAVGAAASMRWNPRTND